MQKLQQEMDKSSKNKQIEKIIKHFIGNTSKAD